MNFFNTIGSFICCLIFLVQNSNAQEILLPLSQNSALISTDLKPYQSKKTRLILPFIDDFSNLGPYPDASKWTDNQVFINNTYSKDQITKGVASFDGLNAKGKPYFPFASSSGYADSLTSQPIDLSSFGVLSNVFLSFYYQPAGLSFSPEIDDSLLLYFKNNNDQWEKVWQMQGSAYVNFKLEFVPVNATRFFHNNFQFRFVNIASLNINDDIWNLDYVKLDANRTLADTNMNDAAFTIQPDVFLYPYSSMPYRHFLNNQNTEVAAAQLTHIKNNYNNTITLSSEMKATEVISSTSLNNTPQAPNVTLGAKSTLPQTYNTFNLVYNPPNNKSKVIMNQVFSFNQINPNDFKGNDTIVRQTVFDNYFAYDDGSAEKAYFLYPAPNSPSKLALKFHLNEADTLRGLMVNFAPKLPTAAGKFISMILYKSLGSGSANDSIIKQQDLYKVMYDSNRNGFSSYAFSQAIPLTAGEYYIGITQPANFGSDSVYYGFDVNNNTSNQFLFYNVAGTWEASSVAGSVMIRPIVGQVFEPTHVTEQVASDYKIIVFPNPCQDYIQIKSNLKLTEYVIKDWSGRNIQNGKMNERNIISMNQLSNGFYILQIKDELGNLFSQKINKQN